VKKHLLIAAIAGVAAAIAVTAAFAKTSASSGAAATGAATLRCGKTRTIGFAGPITGPAASLGQQQLNWSKQFVTTYNRTHRKTKVRLVQGDTQLPNVAEAIKVAQRFASTGRILGVVGPAGSQEVVDSTAAYRGGGLAFVSGSATRTSLTDGSRRGFFYRVVPNDDVQGPTVAKHIIEVLKAKRVFIIDDQETYSQGLSDTVQKALTAGGVRVERDSVSQSASDFSSLIAKIGNNVDVVYIPWQLAPKAQLFGQQMREQGKRATLFGSDGLFDPDNFKIPGSLVSFFPVDTNAAVVKAYMSSHGGSADFFGAPTYVATQAVVGAIDRACAAGRGRTTRAAVRRALARTKIAKTVLGLPLAFTANGDLQGGAFGIYRIGSNGAYSRIG
jgi:branched-chain amino acid transport system substrate-binding protein